MIDQYGRCIHYMRISITDRCNYHCQYCSPGSFKHLSHHDILRYEEMIQICQAAIKLGIVDFKVTGGEPTVRKDYLYFLRMLKSLEGVATVTLTTNGWALDHDALDELKEMEIDGINFSIDTLNKEKYALICGKDGLDQVIDHLLYGISIGLNIKINTVVNETFTQDDLRELLSFFQDLPISLRFIEKMPLNSSYQMTNKMEEVKSYLYSHYQVEELSKKLGNGPAHYLKIKNKECSIGFIEALHHKFCEECNRVRLSSTGQLKPCLFYPQTVSLKPYLEDHSRLKQVMQDTIYQKPKEHHFEKESSQTIMNQIGG